MIRRSFLAVAGLVSALLVSTPAEARWVEVETTHFLLYGELSPQQATSYAMQLEAFDSLLRSIAKVPSTPESEGGKVTVYAVPLPRVQALAGSRMVGGFYRSTADGNLAVMPTSLPDEMDVSPFHLMFHEYTHHIFLSSTEAYYPSWVQEGLAEFFGTVRFKPDGTLLLGAPPQMRGWSLHSQYQLTLEELLGNSGEVSDRAIESKYAKGWLLTHYLLLSKKRPGQYDRYLRLVAKGVPSLEAGRQAFGDLRKLDGELEAYNRTGRFATFIAPTPPVVGAPKTRTLRDCEARMMPMRVRSTVGVDTKSAPKLVEPARAVGAECPNDPFVQQSLAEIEFDAKNNKEAMAAADRALAANSASIGGMIYKGRVHARQSQWGEARQWFAKAYRQNPNYALPLVLYYDTFMAAGATPTKAAVDGLLRAIIIAPQDDSVRLRVAYQLITEGDLPLARKVLEPVAYAAHGSGENKALNVVKKIDAKAPQATVLAEAKAAKWHEIGKE